MKTAVLCGKLFDSETASVLENMVVLIEDKAITEVRSGTTAPEGYEGVDLQKYFVTPGLIDAHVHLEFVGNESPDEAAYILPGELTVRAVKSVRADLMAGFTTVRDCGGTDYINLSIRDAVARGDLEGARVCLPPDGASLPRAAMRIVTSAHILRVRPTAASASTARMRPAAPRGTISSMARISSR